MIVSMYNTPTYHTGFSFCLSQDCTLSLEWIEEMNEEQQYHVRRGLEAFIGGEAHPTIEMVAEEGARQVLFLVLLLLVTTFLVLD